MSKVIVTKEKLQNIADAIRAKASTSDALKLDDMPTAIQNISGGGGGDPTDPVQYRAMHRNPNYPFIPLPSQMRDATSEHYEANDTVWLLYNAETVEVNPCFDMNGTGLSITAYKYHNTTLVSTQSIAAVNGINVFHFNDDDADWDSYNYLLLKCTGASITTMNLNADQIGRYGQRISPNSSSKLSEVSGNCVSCAVYVSSSSTPQSHLDLEYYSYHGVYNANMNYMFQNCYSLQAIPELDTHAVTNMSYMFQNCYSLQAIPELDTHAVTNMSYMFSSCYSLQAIPELDTHAVTNMNHMFQGCYSLKDVVLHFYKIESTANAASIFANCYMLRSIIIKEFGTSYVANTNTFQNCYCLSGTNNEYHPTSEKDGFIYVPATMVETLRAATNWSTYASQIVAIPEGV